MILISWAFTEMITGFIIRKCVYVDKSVWVQSCVYAKEKHISRDYGRYRFRNYE